MAETFSNRAATTLNGGITDIQTNITVTDPAPFPSGPNFRIIIEDEIMLVTVGGNATPNWTVTRGQEGTTNELHADLSVVTHVVTAASLVNIVHENTELVYDTSPQLGADLDVNGKYINFGDTNTQIWENGSSDLSFKDANAGTMTLTQLKSMRNIWIQATTDTPVADVIYVTVGDSVSGATMTSSDADWSAQYVYISSIKVKTTSTNWDLWLFEDIADHGAGAWDTTAISCRHLANNHNGNFDITVAREYNNVNGNRVYFIYADWTYSVEAEVYIVGEARRH